MTQDSRDMVASHAKVEITLILELAPNRTITKNIQHSVLRIDSELSQAYSVQDWPFLCLNLI